MLTELVLHMHGSAIHNPLESKESISGSIRVPVVDLKRWKWAINGAFRVLTARWTLRRCTLNGKRITVRGRPRVDANGRISLGERVSIWSYLAKTQLSAGPGATLEIGANTFVNNGTVISARKLVKIGQGCQIAPHVSIMDFAFHGVEDRNAPPDPSPVIIEENVWLGSRCIVLPGVTIGRNSVIAAGAVVTRNVPENTLAGGVPAKIIRTFEPVTNK